MNGRPFAFALALGLCGACQVSSPEPIAGGVDFDAQPLWEAYWSEDEGAIDSLLSRVTWSELGSIEAERYRQRQRLNRGERGAVIAELDAALEATPFDPDLLYLRARLHQDPARLHRVFEDLASRFPRHAWIRLGAAGSALQVDEPTLAVEHLRLTPDWADAREFRRLIEARLGARLGAREPWLGLIDDALYRGIPASLAELRALARERGNDSLMVVADAESQLRRQFRTSPLEAGSEAESEALRLLLQRMRAELRWQPQTTPSELLSRADGWAESLGLPMVWGATPAYHLPLDLGLLLRPEQDESLLGELLTRHHLALLMGWSWLDGSRIVQMEGVERIPVTWPGVAQPLEIWLADRALGDGPWVSGGAVFRGFFVRRDLVDETARRITVACERVDVEKAGQLLELEGSSFELQAEAVGSLPEDADLPLRLRTLLNGADRETAREREWRALLLHEAGHLPEVLPWTQPQEQPISEALGMSLQSLMRDGWLLSEWEYRAQLRALASGEEVLWQLAYTVEVARNPSEPYHKPYRRLIQRLIATARKDDPNAPVLANWHRLEAEQVTAWARQLAAQDGLDLLPEGAVRQLLERSSPFAYHADQAE